MITVAMGYILKPEEPETTGIQIPENKKVSLVYNYKLFPDTSFNKLKKGDKIFFGDKEVGLIKEMNLDNTTGKIEMKKDFPLYNNMDFYIFSMTTGKPRVELRIDPTRERELHDAEDATITMKVMP
jgi:hypothetical protein